MSLVINRVLVVVNRIEEVVNDDLVRRLTKELPNIVFKALTAKEEGGELLPGDIEIRVDSSSKLDVNVQPLGIVIWAADLALRRNTFDFRRKIIIDKVKELIPSNVRGHIQIILSPMSCGEF